MDGECVADGLVMDVPVGFDGMAEDVHAGAGGDVSGDGPGQFRVDEGGVRVEGRGVQGRFDAFFVVGMAIRGRRSGGRGIFLSR